MKHPSSGHFCPACGPVPTWATSNYCRHHTTEMWTTYLELRATKSVTVGAPRP